MKKFCFFALIFCILTIMLEGCDVKDGIQENVDVIEKIKKMQSYSTNAEIKILSNNNENVYTVYIIWEKDGKYLIKANSPEILKGNIILFDGNGLWLYNPNVNSKISLSGVGNDFDGKNKIFITEFMKGYLGSNGLDEKKLFKNGKNYRVITINTNGGKYFDKQKLWLDIDENVPYKLETFDADGKIISSAVFSDFKFDVQISQNEFDISTR